MQTKLTIDPDKKTLIIESEDGIRTVDLHSKEAFELVSDWWVKLGWVQRYSYTFSWMGRPVIQLPEDMIRIQEVIHRVRPDVILETGVAHGGSLIFYASLCKAMGNGRVVGIDIEIRTQNRVAIEAHELSRLITLIEGSSTEPTVVDRARAEIQPDDRVIVILDSCHTKDHVLDELEAYAPLVTRDSYLVATDGIMKDLSDTCYGKPDWTWNNPAAAASEFVLTHPEFVLEQPPWPFNESALTKNVTYWPSAYLRKKP
jgi:cephalosporin hydroxylase